VASNFSAELLPISPELHAHASGALWVPETRTAIIADLHLGYSWAQRRRGELGPLADARTREKLLGVRDQLQPSRYVFLGDVVHAPRPCEPERAWIEAILHELASGAKLIAVRGNHDRRFAAEFAHLSFQHVVTWSERSVTAAHGDRMDFVRPQNHTLILGHLHPALEIRDSSGAGHKVPVFLANRHCLVLPAFSPFARGFDIVSGIPPELLHCFAAEEIEVYAATGKKVARLGPLRSALNSMAESDVSSAAQFRKRYRGG
jgi:putative SbcD/Mre11-related phosphoesterase